MQKRYSFYAELQPVKVKGWVPAPREASTVTCVNNDCYLVGGQNHGCNDEVAVLMTSEYTPYWRNLNFSSNEHIQGRSRHTSVAYEAAGKVFVFGGCFMYDMQRESRECTN